MKKKNWTQEQKDFRKIQIMIIDIFQKNKIDYLLGYSILTDLAKEWKGQLKEEGLDIDKLKEIKPKI